MAFSTTFVDNVAESRAMKAGFPEGFATEVLTLGRVVLASPLNDGHAGCCRQPRDVRDDRVRLLSDHDRCVACVLNTHIR